MARLFWGKKNSDSSVSFEAKTFLDNFQNMMEENFATCDISKKEKTDYRYLDSALSHWEGSQCSITKAMNTTNPPDNLLETIFSFQNDHVQIFINLEGAQNNDIKLTNKSEEGGFDIVVTHSEKRVPGGAQQAAIRRVTRSYRFFRPCYWDRMEHSITQDGILQIIVPGPMLIAQQIPMSSSIS